MNSRVSEQHLLNQDPDDFENNPVAGPSIRDLIAQGGHRRQVLKGMGAFAASMFGGASLIGCGSADVSAAGSITPVPVVGPYSPATVKKIESLAFAAVTKNTRDEITVPPGYTATVLYATGDAIDPAVPDYLNNGTNDNFARRVGEHSDALHYYGMNVAGNGRDTMNNDRALLVMNHENITGTVQFLHAAGQTNATTGARPADEALKEIEAHGVSIVEIQRINSRFQMNKSSTYNRRITARSEMDISGPARGNPSMFTAYSSNGTKTRGTINNCASGYTPWGTYLTCEENWAGYFKRDDSTGARTARDITSLARHGITNGRMGNYRWTTAIPTSAQSPSEFSRWDISYVAGAPADGTGDFRNAANTFGWVVEVDPFAQNSIPVKRTSLGRFAHEGAWPSVAIVGEPIALYQGCDSRNEYVYKFVSKAVWSEADRDAGLAGGAKYLDEGTLYAAVYNADGTGRWAELSMSNPLVANFTGPDATRPFSFANLGQVVIDARLAAGAVGATRMDRPEYTAVNPANGEIYITMTENPDRGNSGRSGNDLANPPLDAANPRAWLDNKGISSQNAAAIAQRGNVNGHIVRMRETDSKSAALTFDWDIFLFANQATADGAVGALAANDDVNYQANVNLSGLTSANDLSKPDGAWFSKATGILWIETDDNTFTDQTNCMLLASVPGVMGDGKVIDVVNLPSGSPQFASTPPAGNVTIKTKIGARLGEARFKRFMTGPVGAEVTGVDETPDGKTLFVNIQHPGENTRAGAAAFESNWPGNGGGVGSAYGAGGTTARPRSATIMITKNDGGLIGT